MIKFSLSLAAFRRQASFFNKKGLFLFLSSELSLSDDFSSSQFKVRETGERERVVGEVITECL